MIIISDYSA